MGELIKIDKWIRFGIYVFRLDAIVFFFYFAKNVVLFLVSRSTFFYIPEIIELRNK